MYFHDITFGRNLAHDLSMNGYSVRSIQAEHKIGRIRIFLPFDFSEEGSLISYIQKRMSDQFNSEWIHKITERKRGFEISAFSEDQCIMEFKELITL